MRINWRKFPAQIISDLFNKYLQEIEFTQKLY